jgi:hypothetical protein
MIDGELLAVIAERAGVAGAILERISGPLGEAARQRLAELRGMPAAQRVAEMAQVLARVSSPLPRAMREVHPDWVQAALEAEPEARAAMAVASAGEGMEPATVWMLRRAFGALPLQVPEVHEVEGARAELARAGALALVAVLGGRRVAVAAAMAQLGERGETLRVVAREQEAQQVAPMELTAATRACRGVDLKEPEALERIGVAAMGRELGRERERWRALCWCLPRAVGRLIAERVR